MYHALTASLNVSSLAAMTGVVFALALLALLVALAFYGGIYYSIPRMLSKWVTRLTLPVS